VTSELHAMFDFDAALAAGVQARGGTRTEGLLLRFESEEGTLRLWRKRQDAERELAKAHRLGETFDQTDWRVTLRSACESVNGEFHGQPVTVVDWPSPHVAAFSFDARTRGEARHPVNQGRPRAPRGLGT